MTSNKPHINVFSQMASKITGMLIDLDSAELEGLYRFPERFDEKVDEARKLLMSQSE